MNLQGLEALPAWDMDSHIFQVLSHLGRRTSLEFHAVISPGVHLGTLTDFERKGLIQDGEPVGNGRWVCAQVCQLRAAHTACPGAVWRVMWCNWVRPGAAWMTDERSESWGLCAGLSTVNPRKGPPGGEVTSSMVVPKKIRKPVTRHPTSGNSATAISGSLVWRIFIQKDGLQLCLDWPGILLQETLEGDVFQMFLVVQCSTWMPLVLYQEGNWGKPWQSRAGHIRPGHHWEPSLGSPDALISMCVKVGLEGWYSLLTGAGWWAPCDLGSCQNHTWRRAVRMEIGSLRCFHFRAWDSIF